MIKKYWREIVIVFQFLVIGFLVWWLRIFQDYAGAIGGF